MANARGKAIDNTHLSIDQAETRGFIHRDYIAHCLRWSHVANYLSKGHLYETADILDIGCGRDLPLARLLYSSRLIPKTGSYTGIDVNPLSVPFSLGKFPYELVERTDVCRWDSGGSTFRVITCFEVLEHVEPEHSFRMLKRIGELLEPDGVAFLSTPNYSATVGAAANHVNEMSYDGLRFLIECAGLKVDKVYGTFASIRDYKDQIDAQGLTRLFDSLREYYDSNYLSTIFAPLFPEQSRNCLWRVSKDTIGVPPNHLPSQVSDARHSSSTLWSNFITENFHAS
jgi:2-polyprenyl-3-methyl-5-hydroxy-6-metoxy-1,4-benzoquinol methylase